MSYISNIAINKIIENYKLSNIKGMIEIGRAHV